MRKVNFGIAVLFAAAVLFSGCKKKDDPTPLKSFSFPTTTNLQFDMTWTVNGQAQGNNYVDLDLYIYDTAPSAANDVYDYGSFNSTGFESYEFSKANTNKTYTVGVNYYENEANISNLTAPYTITYTIKVYPVGNAAAAQTYTGTITSTTTSPDDTKIYNQLTMDKSASTYSFTELATKTTYTNN